QRVRAGTEAAAAHRPRLVALEAILVGNRRVADDVLEEDFHCDSPPPRAKFEAWRKSRGGPRACQERAWEDNPSDATDDADKRQLSQPLASTHLFAHIRAAALRAPASACSSSPRLILTEQGRPGALLQARTSCARPSNGSESSGIRLA